MSTWHIDAQAAEAYADGRLDDPAAWSLEAHVEQCSACARVVSSAADPAALAQLRELIDLRLRSRARGFVRLTVTPTLTRAWLAAVAGVVLGVLALDLLDSTTVPLMLLVAPLLPLLGLVIGCSTTLDHGAELMASTPVSALQVLLWRAAAVLVVSVLPLLLVSLVTRTASPLWLAPSAALVALSLALATRLRVETATGAAAALWVAVTLGPAAVAVPSPPGLRAGATAGWFVLTAVCLVALALRRDRLEQWHTTMGAAR